MSRSRERTPERRGRRRQPATTPEAREAELSMKAYDLAETQLENGTASSQVITHFVKAGSRREQMEQLKIAHEIELMEVKKDALASQARTEALFEEALVAMRSYSGMGSSGELEE